MVATTERLREIRRRVRQSHMLVAADMLQRLIDDLEAGTELEPHHALPRVTRKPAPRRNGHGMPTCRYAWRQTKRGLVQNRKHQCRPACTWTPEEDLHWLDVTPLPGGGKLMVRRSLTYCLCKRPMNGQHYETVADERGGIKGLREIKCEYMGRETGVPSL